MLMPGHGGLGIRSNETRIPHQFTHSVISLLLETKVTN